MSQDKAMRRALSLCLEVVVFFRKRDSLGLCKLLLVLLHESGVNLDLSRCESGCGNELQRRVTNKLPRKPKERLFEVVVGLRGDLEVLDVLLPVEGDLTSLHFPLLYVDLVTAEHDRDVLANTLKITVPVGHILVRDARGNIEHDDTALALDVVAITETTKLLLPGSVPDVEADCAKVGGEGQRVHLDTEGGDVLLLEFTRQVALDESGLSSTSIANYGPSEPIVQ